MMMPQSHAATMYAAKRGRTATKTRLHRARARLRDQLYTRAGAAASSAFQLHLDRCDRVVARVLERIASVAPGCS